MQKNVKGIVKALRSLGSPEVIQGMARYGIRSAKVYGVSVGTLREFAKEIGKDHELAGKLWATGILDARILAAFVEVPARVTETQMDRWARGFDNWAICDGCCLHLFDKTPFAWKKAVQWATRKEEFVKRGAFSLMALLAVHDKKAHDREFLRLLPIIKKAASDERNGVKKAVNWALRQIGKRNRFLNNAAIRTAEAIRKSDSRAPRWIAADALRELKSEAVQSRLKKKERV